MTTSEVLEDQQSKTRAERHPLPGGCTLISWTSPGALLAPEHEELRRSIVAVSDQAFGRSTAGSWEEKFSGGFLGALTCFYLLVEPDGTLVGWSGYRARTIAAERVVYFTSTGLLPRWQGHGLISSLQRLAMAAEARRHPLRPVTLAVRTRNPHAYRLAVRTFGASCVVPGLDGSVPVGRRAIVATVASWLDFSYIDPVTATIRGAYPATGGLYGEEPRSADPAVNDLFDRLTPEDALLVLGRLSRRASVSLAVRGR